jgi:hypothetical protein
MVVLIISTVVAALAQKISIERDWVIIIAGASKKDDDETEDELARNL